MPFQKNKEILLSLVSIFGTSCLTLGCFTNVDAQNPPQSHKNQSESSTAPKLYFEAQGIQATIIKEVSGLEVTAAPPEEVHGSSKGGTRQATPTAHKFTNITLKLVASKDSSIYKWYETATQSKLKSSSSWTTNRKFASVSIYDNSGTLQSRWEIQNCYPVKYIGPTLNASSDKVLTETIELVHEGVKRVQ
jgi:phage tail-like protein